MHRGTRTEYRPARVLLAAVVTLLATVVTGPAATAAPDAAPSARAAATLRCSLRTASPVTFSPAVSGTPRNVTARGTVNLNGCTSPDGRRKSIRSGRLTVRGSGRATCSRVSGVRGSATVTWYSGAGRTGRVVGRSAVTPAAAGVSGYTPLDSFLSGRITSGPMAGRHITGRAAPTTNVSSCYGRGLRSVGLRGTVTVS
ncbi:hypothetical protein NX794_17795 [Streptomyces sp. LP11]|uniref:Uncharacterized protein n=1 Tax=Streptomyces pyxinicus TaxID=2970331 RepID=A0ABT2B3F9_9ACTN|nr:hypothetical protein [Streptomyces sp. LP11]MCS0603051.1 hypothetical protein [Streptomyces sp. LP11]